MHGKATGFSFKVVITIKKKSIPGVFTCSSYEKDVGEVVLEQLRYDVIKDIGVTNFIGL